MGLAAFFYVGSGPSLPGPGMFFLSGTLFTYPYARLDRYSGREMYLLRSPFAMN